MSQTTKTLAFVFAIACALQLHAHNNTEPGGGDGIVIQVHESSKWQVLKNFAEALAFKAQNKFQGTSAFNFDAYKIEKKSSPSLSDRSHSELLSLELEAFSKEFFSYYALISAAPSQAPYKELLVGLVKKDRNLVERVLNVLSGEEKDRAYRILSYSQEKWIADLPQVKALRARYSALAAQKIHFSKLLDKKEDTKLFNMLIMLSLRAPKREMLASKMQQWAGFGDGKVRPVIRKGDKADVIKNEARLFAVDFNQRVEANPEEKLRAFDTLLSELFALYLTRYEEPREEPWFFHDGYATTMSEFMTEFRFAMEPFKQENLWMEVSNLRASTVFNPILKSKGLARQMWWNRFSGYSPLGNTRVSRNYDPNKEGFADATQSIEVLHQSKDKIYVPYLFERKNGKLSKVSGPKARDIMLSCFGCHLRLTELFTGGINMKNYKPSPDWFINDFDMLMSDHHHLLVAQTTGEAICTVVNADLQRAEDPSAIGVRLSCHESLFTILKPGQPLRIRSKLKVLDQWLAPYRVDASQKIVELLYDAKEHSTAEKLRELNWTFRKLKASLKSHFGVGKQLTVQVHTASPYHAQVKVQPKTVVLLSGGTGVTPNLAIWDSLKDSKTKRVWIQIAPEASRLFFQREVTQSSRLDDELRFFATRETGRPVLEVELAPFDNAQSIIYACGPKGMLSVLPGIIKKARFVTCFDKAMHTPE